MMWFRLLVSFFPVATAAVPYAGFPSPGEMWKDTSGNQIRAHQPNIVLLGDTYYWYGAAQVANSSGFKGHINLYTSRDLYNWDFVGPVYSAPGGYVARPSMIGINPVTKKYVMWMKGSGTTSFQVAEADRPDGEFKTVSELPAPFGSESGGSQAFKNPNDDSAFIFYSNKEPREMRVAQLTPDWRHIEQKVLAVIGKHFEAPAPFYSTFTKKFYVLCSHLSGWWPNPAELFVADQPAGPWRSIGNPTDDDTSHNTQVAHVLPITSATDHTQRLVYIGDRWKPYVSMAEGGRYVFLPMEIRGMPLQAVNPHSHIVSRGPVLRGQKDGSILIRSVGNWSLEQWPQSDDKVGFGRGSRGLPGAVAAVQYADSVHAETSLE